VNRPLHEIDGWLTDSLDEYRMFVTHDFTVWRQLFADARTFIESREKPFPRKAMLPAWAVQQLAPRGEPLEVPVALLPQAEYSPVIGIKRPARRSPPP
jgi:hypothetical protein